MFNYKDRRINWRYFPLFLLALLLLGSLALLLLLNYLGDGYFNPEEWVEEVPLLPFEREEEESGPDAVEKSPALLMIEGGRYQDQYSGCRQN